MLWTFNGIALGTPGKLSFTLVADISGVSGGDSGGGLNGVGDIINGTALVLGVSLDTSKVPSLFSSSTFELWFSEIEKCEDPLSSPESASFWDEMLEILSWPWLYYININEWNVFMNQYYHEK